MQILFCIRQNCSADIVKPRAKWLLLSSSLDSIPPEITMPMTLMWKKSGYEREKESKEETYVDAVRDAVLCYRATEIKAHGNVIKFVALCCVNN